MRLFIGGPFCACSGQSALSKTRKRDWGIARTNNDPAWWRLTDIHGRMRRFGSLDAAQKVVNVMNETANKTGLKL